MGKIESGLALGGSVERYLFSRKGQSGMRIPPKKGVNRQSPRVQAALESVQIISQFRNSKESVASRNF
jgi:hypothetical protein